MKKLLISLLLLAGCHHAPTSYPINSWKQQDASGDWIWYYVMFSHMNSCPCYSYSSPTQVTNFSSVTFERSEVLPPALNVETAQAQPVVEVPAAEAPAEAEAWSENFDANDSHETNEPSEGFDESSPASESESSGSSDGGGSDGGSSGGDGGGGGGGEWPSYPSLTLSGD